MQKRQKPDTFAHKFLQSVELPTGRPTNAQIQTIFRNHRILHIKIKTLLLVMFPWSPNLNLNVCQHRTMIFHKLCGALICKPIPPKSHGALFPKCSASGVCKRITLEAPLICALQVMAVRMLRFQSTASCIRGTHFSI